MLETALTLLGWLAILAGLALVHELGHYYAGRHIVGIPATDIRLVPVPILGYVALREGTDWVSPTESASYREAYGQFDPEFEHFERFMAAGELIQTAVVVPVALALWWVGHSGLAWMVLLLSLALTLAAVVVDAALTRYADAPTGDYSVLWEVSWTVPVALLFAVLSVHVAGMFLVG